MCDCLYEIPKKIHDKFPTYNNKNVEEVEVHHVWLFSDSGMRKGTATDFELSLEGQKKKHSITVNHTFCPFCGKKYEEPETINPEQTQS